MNETERAYFSHPSLLGDSPHLRFKRQVLAAHICSPWLAVGRGATDIERGALGLDLVGSLLRAPRDAVGDVERLPCCPGSLACISALAMLNYVPSQHRAVAEFHRALQPGGVAVLEFQGWSLRALHSIWKYPIAHYPLWPWEIRAMLRDWEILEWHRCLRDVLPAKHLVVARRRLSGERPKVNYMKLACDQLARGIAPRDPFLVRCWVRFNCTSGAVILTMLIAQIVGLGKLEATIWLTGYIQDPLWLRCAAYTMGISLAALTSYGNILLLRRFK